MLFDQLHIHGHFGPYNGMVVLVKAVVYVCSSYLHSVPSVAPSEPVTNMPLGNAYFPSLDVIIVIINDILLNLAMTEHVVSVGFPAIVQVGAKLVSLITEHFPVCSVA